METTFKKALDHIKADEALKNKTADYIRSLDNNVILFSGAAGARRKPFAARRLVAAACVAVVLCALPVGAYAVYQTPTSYVSVDINPSVELAINTFGKVVKVTPYNTDGQAIVNGLELLNKNVESAVQQVVKSASDKGFIKDDGSTLISVTTVTNSDTAAQKLEQDAKAGADTAVTSENDTATVETDHVGLDLHKEAATLGMTPGKLNLIQKLQALDPSIKTEDYKDASVTDIQKKFNELKKEHDGQNKDDKDNKDEASFASPSASAPHTAKPDVTTSATVSPNSGSEPNGNSNSSHNGNGNKKNDSDTSKTTGENGDSDKASASPSGGNSKNGHDDSSHSNNKDKHDDKDDKHDD